jgi:hypothetical protein
MDDIDAAAMASAMGFSSFGAQNPHKRRKYNSGADAVVAVGNTTTTVPLHGRGRGKVAGSGANAAPLGTRTHNKDEVDLEIEEDTDVAGSAVIAEAAEGDGDREPQYIDTSRPAASAITSGDSIQTRSDSAEGVHLAGSQPSATMPFSQGRHGGVPSGGGYQGHHGRGPNSGKIWWEGYYDPSSNINPWQRLEEAKGLKPRGSWMTWEQAKG